jgi:hypothetical protein
VTPLSDELPVPREQNCRDYLRAMGVAIAKDSKPAYPLTSPPRRTVYACGCDIFPSTGIHGSR